MKLLFIDTETGGLDSTKHSLLSYAMLAWEDGVIVDSLEIFLKSDQYSVTAGALGINNIDLVQHHAKAISPVNAGLTTEAFLSKNFSSDIGYGNHYTVLQPGSIIIAGHNIGFDKAFLQAQGFPFTRYFSHRMIDTSGIIKYLYISGKIPQDVSSSNKAFDFFKVVNEQAHDALSDAKATAQLFNKLLSPELYI